ncbi:SPOR domain-containing protein [Paracrocinitomix mangrovi]|nr:SPOR domain-containing protein [Paracrocinitomix mangrovi]UKN03844.1 SPOR domain-containing protein [Paracrocinitomix mangrovi]
MEGDGFEKPGCDGCIGKEYDPGFLYKINSATFEIENVVQVGAIPKYLAITPDQNKLLVSNWTSSDVSVVDLNTEKEVERITVGAHPRGIAITADSKTAFVTVMGSTKVAEINLDSYQVSYIENVGKSPRHLILGNSDSCLYVSLNSARSVLRYNRFSGQKSYCKTQSGPRSMCMSPKDDFLYVVNYFDHSFSKISTRSMEVVEEVKTGDKPIGICGNWDDSEIWVACYSGKIEIFKDFHLDSLHHGTSLFGYDLSSFWKPNVRESSENEDELVEEDLMVETNEIEEEIEENEVLPVVFSNKKPIKPLAKRDFVKQTVIEPSSGTCKYHLIAGSFSDINNAKGRMTELVDKGYAAQILNGNLNYVSVACFDNRESADDNIGKIKADTGYSVWVLKR